MLFILKGVLNIMENKFYKVTQEIDGKKYTGQFNGLSQVFDMQNICKSVYDGQVVLDEKKTSEYALENVIVDPPHLTIDDFDNLDTLNKVLEFARGIMSGNFRDQAIKNTNKAGSGK